MYAKMTVFRTFKEFIYHRKLTNLPKTIRPRLPSCESRSTYKTAIKI